MARTRESLERRLAEEQKNLHLIEEKITKYTELEAPIHLLTQCDDTKRRIVQIEEQLRHIPPEPSPTVPPGPPRSRWQILLLAGCLAVVVFIVIIAGVLTISGVLDGLLAQLRPPTLTPTPTKTPVPSPTPTPYYVEIVVDASGRMSAKFEGGITKMESAWQTAGTIARTRAQRGQFVSIRTFGSGGEQTDMDCFESCSVFPFTNRDSEIKAHLTTPPIPGGQAAVVTALTDASAELMAYKNIGREIILLTGGDDECGSALLAFYSGENRSLWTRTFVVLFADEDFGPFIELRAWGADINYSLVKNAAQAQKAAEEIADNPPPTPTPMALSSPPSLPTPTTGGGPWPVSTPKATLLPPTKRVATATHIPKSTATPLSPPTSTATSTSPPPPTDTPLPTPTDTLLPPTHTPIATPTFTPPSAHADTLYVNGASGSDTTDCTNSVSPCATIGYALDQAADFDTILVAEGIYTENLVITKTVTLEGGYEPVGWSRSLHRCTTIDGNQSDSVIRIGSTLSETTMIDGFTIINGKYGGIRTLLSSVAVQNSKIVHNHTTGGGGGMRIDRSFVTITNTLIADNTSAQHDGAICIVSPNPGPESKVRIYNSTIANNSASEGRNGIFCSLSACGVANSIVWGHEGEDFSGHGHGAIYSNIEMGLSGEGNISVDPLFVDPASGDYHLRPDSPCIDAGTNEAAPETDFEGNPRPVDGNRDGPPVTDMGADEMLP